MEDKNRVQIMASDAGGTMTHMILVDADIARSTSYAVGVKRRQARNAVTKSKTASEARQPPGTYEFLLPSGEKVRMKGASITPSP